MMPPPGAPVEERLIARFRGHARRLLWSAVLLVVVCGATGYLYGNLPAPFEDWMLLAGGALLVVVGVILPYLIWASRTYTITTRRVIVRDGIGSATGGSSPTPAAIPSPCVAGSCSGCGGRAPSPSPTASMRRCGC